MAVIWDCNLLIVSWDASAEGLEGETTESAEGIVKHVDPNFIYPFAHETDTVIG